MYSKYIHHQEIANLVYEAFQEAFAKKDKGALKNNNTFRSSYFVSLIGAQLEKHFEKYESTKVHYQAVQSIEASEKKSGEWLFDICVTRYKTISKTIKKDINTHLLFACESEFNTGLHAFATDFGKLICSNAKQYLFIQGLNQKTATGRFNFIEARKKIIQEQLGDLIDVDFVLAFVPSPVKVDQTSFWDTAGAELLSWLSIWVYKACANKFVEVELSKIIH